MTTDVGSHKIMAGQAWTAYAPRGALITNGLSAMGFGLPAAIGAALSGGGPVVCLTGDCGFAMTATSVGPVAIPALAESLGCDGVRVDSVTGLEKALSAASAGRVRPLVIEARVDTSQYSAQF